jgi:transcriptional regulator with XRE-family HTH domain
VGNNKRNLKIKNGHFRGILKDNGITTKELSQKIGITQVTLNSKIIGNIRFTLDDIFKILKVLNMTFEEVFICKD